jgi:hypothetical protein
MGKSRFTEEQIIKVLRSTQPDRRLEMWVGSTASGTRRFTSGDRAVAGQIFDAGKLGGLRKRADDASASSRWSLTSAGNAWAR